MRCSQRALLSRWLRFYARTRPVRPIFFPSSYVSLSLHPAAIAPAAPVAELGVVRRHLTRPVKRKISLLLAVAVIAVAAAYFFQPDRSIDYASFQPRLEAAFRSGGFTTVELASCSGERVPFPWSLRPPPRRSHSLSGIHVAIGFPDSAYHYKLVSGGSPPFDCFVRYSDSRAAFIAIRAHAAQAGAARALRATLAQEFPRFTITLATNDA